jgi:sterol 3beta-glucosyltransferase
MKILITTFGTRGDIQPYIAFGKGLLRAGYDVALGTSEGYRSLVEEHQLQYIFLDRNLLRLTQGVMGETSQSDTFAMVKQMMPAMREMMEHEWLAAQSFEPDLILYHPKCMGSLHVAEKLGIPAVLSLPLPFYTPTKEFPVPFLSNIHLGAWFNRFSYWLMAMLPSAMYGGMINNFRTKTLGLPKNGRFANSLARHDGTPVPVIYPYSPTLLPVPEDFPEHAYVTGYWFLDHSPDWQPEPALVEFLETGTPPVYIGFGSMGGRGAQKRAMIALEALQKTGQRGLFARGWGGLSPSDLPANTFMLDSVPHDWLFPKVAAVVHHGGAGTTAAGLRAGKPTVVCPFIADQPFWGDLVYLRGAGPKPVPQSRLTAARLAEAITEAVTNQTIQQQAAYLGKQIDAEDGVTCGVEVIGTFLKQPPLTR